MNGTARNMSVKGCSRMQTSPFYVTHATSAGAPPTSSIFKVGGRDSHALAEAVPQSLAVQQEGARGAAVGRPNL